MKHLQKGRTLGRKDGPRKALLKNLAKSLILHEKIETTEAKAKELRPFVEKLITQARIEGIHSHRLIMRKLADNLITDKLVKEIAPKYKERKGGYTRIIKTGSRPGDNAKMAVIELVK
jgi:large subunit ribosomal protein L17